VASLASWHGFSQIYTWSTMLSNLLRYFSLLSALKSLFGLQSPEGLRESYGSIKTGTCLHLSQGLAQRGTPIPEQTRESIKGDLKAGSSMGKSKSTATLATRESRDPSGYCTRKQRINEILGHGCRRSDGQELKVYEDT